MAYTIPPDTRAAGDSGHVTDHDDMSDVLSGMYSGSLNVLNTTWAGGADPTGSTDSAAAFQAALNAASGGGTVYVPPGNYVISSASLAMPAGVTLAGAGNLSRLEWDYSKVPVLLKAPSASPVQYARIRDLRLSHTNATSGGTCIDASYFQFSLIERLLIDNSGTGAKPLAGVSYNAGTCHYNAIADCVIFTDGPGSKCLAYDGGANSNVARNMRLLPSATQSSSYGAYVNAYAIELDHVDVESSAGTAVYVGAGATTNRPTVLAAPYLEANGHEVVIASGACPPSFPGTRITLVKAADTARSSTTSLAADPDLAFTALEGRAYLLDLWLLADGASGADMAFAFSLPSGATLTGSGMIAPQPGVTSQTDAQVNMTGWAGNGTQVIGTPGAGSSYTMTTHARAVLVTGATSATCALTWAQSASSATATTLRAGSSMTIEQIA